MLYPDLYENVMSSLTPFSAVCSDSWSLLIPVEEFCCLLSEEVQSEERDTGNAFMYQHFYAHSLISFECNTKAHQIDSAHFHYIFRFVLLV